MYQSFWFDRYDNKTDKQVIVWERWVVEGEVLRQ